MGNPYLYRLQELVDEVESKYYAYREALNALDELLHQIQDEEGYPIVKSVNNRET